MEPVKESKQSYQQKKKKKKKSKQWLFSLLAQIIGD
jgi:hypothetical protein